MIPAKINYRWDIVLPEHRKAFHHERAWWEAARLADMFSLVDSFVRVVPRPPVVCDVGSEEGDFSALYGLWGAHVVCIDPSEPWMRQTVDIFAANDLEPPTTLVGFAHTETVEGTVGHARGFHDYAPGYQTYALRDIPADVYVVDVEGHEGKVLEGADLDHDAVWYISIHGDVDPHASTPSAIHETMRQHGFRDQWLGYQHEWFYRFYR